MPLRVVFDLIILSLFLSSTRSIDGAMALAPATDPLNVVVIITDDMGWGDVSFNGNSNLETPHIDQLAVSGATFSNFYVQPVCSPLRTCC